MSYFKQLLKNNLVICVCYTIVFTIFASLFIIKIVTGETTNNSKMMLTQISSYIDGCISQFDIASQNLSGNSYIINYSGSDNSNAYARRNVSQFLHNSFSFIPTRDSMISILKEDSDIILSTSDSMQPDYFLSMIGVSKEQFETLKARARDSKNPAENYIISNDNQYKLTIASYISGTSTPIYVFMTFPMSSIMNYADNSNSEIVFTLDNNLLYASENCPESIISSILSKSKFTNNNILSVKSKTRLKELTYYYVIPKSSYHYVMSLPYLVLYLIISIFMILGAFLVLYVTRKTYAPIEKLLNSIESINTKKESSNEFELIKSKINALSISNELLSNKIESYEEPIENNFLRELLYGTATPEDKKENLSRYEIELKCRNYLTAVIEYNVPSLAMSVDASKYVHDTIIQTFCKHYDEKNAFFRLLTIGSKSFAMISAVDDYTRFNRELLHFIVHFNEQAKIEIFASMGSVCSSLDTINESFANALNVSENRIYEHQYTTVCTPEDIKNFKGGGSYYPIDTEATIIENVIHGNSDIVKSLTHKLISTNFIHKSFSAEQFSQFKLMFTATINRILAALKKRSSDVFPEDVVIYLELKTCRTAEELLDKINELLDAIMMVAVPKITDQNTSSKNDMIDFIENNYTSDISLLNLAEHMNFSIEHTSRIFKQLVGQNFKEYLMHYRFQKAKNMIDENPNIQLKEVALAVGCNNTVILSRTFVKYAKMSAGDYLRSRKNNI